MSEEDDWYDNGPGSENFKHSVAADAAQFRVQQFDKNRRNAELAVCLRAFLEGLEAQNIDELMTIGTPGHFRKYGEVMARYFKTRRLCGG